MSSSALDAPSRVRIRLRAIGAFVLVLVLAVAGVIAFQDDSRAAGPGTGWGTWGDNIYGFHGSFSVGNGEHIYCIQPGVPLPTGTTTDQGYVGNVDGVSGNVLAGINAIISKYGQTTNKDQAAAVDFAVKFAADYNKALYSSSYDGRYGHDISGHIHWRMSRFVSQGADLAKIKSLANSYYTEAMNTTASSGKSGSGSFTFQVDHINNYFGTLTVSVSPATATGTVTLTNGYFRDTGSATRSGVKNGQVLPIMGAPPAGGAGGYKIKASGTFTAPGSGYAANVRLYTTPGQQTSVGRGTRTATTFTVTGEDPVVRSGQFIPNLSTNATSFVQEGQSFRDTVTFFTVADDEGTNNPWPVTTQGNYFPVVAHGTLYGPFKSRPAVSDTAPAGAPVAATATVTTTGAQGPTAPYTVTSGSANASGYYSWVWEIHQDRQNSIVQDYIPEGYTFADRFGLTAETSIVPMKPVASSLRSHNWATPGTQITDSLTVSNSNGLWLEGTSARFEGTAYGVPNGAVPTVSDSVPSNAVPLATRSLTFTEPGTKTTSALTVPDNYGSIVWVWRFAGADQAQPEMFAPGYTWQDQYGLANETTRVQMRPVISTQVVDPAPTGAFNDRVTLSIGNGRWIEGARVKVNGTLYGPFLTRPAESATPPAGTPVAHQTSLTFTSATTLTTNTGFTPTAAGYYVWVWDLAAAEQDTATAQAMPAGYTQRDRFGLVAETSSLQMRPAATSKVVQDISGTGQSASDTLTARNTNGPWMSGAQMTFRGTAYAVPSGQRPAVTDAVPASARAISSQTLTFTAEGQKKTSARVEVPNDAGYIVWVWEFVTADQPAAQRHNFPAGYVWRDKFGLPDETTVVQFHPTITTQVVERVPGAAFNDTLVTSTSRGQWVAGVEVIADGTLYGPFTKAPERSSDIPVDAPVAYETSITLDRAGEYTTDTGFRPERSGYYAWVWSIDFDEQTLDTRDLLPPGYLFQDDFGIYEETHILPMIPSAFTNVVQEVADAGTRVHDTLTVENTNGDWIDGAVATYEGTAYSVPSTTAPRPGDEIPDNAVKLFETTLEVDGPGTYESESVIVPDDAGFIVWVWEFHQQRQAQPELWLRDMVWRDQFGLAEETTTVTFEPVLSTQVPERVPAADFNDIVTMSAARGQWHDDTAVVADGTLYGPFTSAPAEGQKVPEDAPVAFETSLTFTEPGAQTTDTGFRPTRSGYYTWVWTVDEGNQSAKTQRLLPDGYLFADRFGLVAETSLLAMIPTASSKVSQTHADAGDEVTDTITVTNSNGDWFDGAVATFHGTAYAVAENTAPVVSDEVPEGAVAILETTIEADGPGTYESESAVVPDDAGYIVWVWTFRQDVQADAEKWLEGMIWQDQYGLAEETTIVTFQPRLTTEVPSRIPAGAFDDTVTVTVDKGQWHAGTTLLAQGVLYGPFTDQPAVTDQAPEGAPVAHRAELRFTQPGALTTDTGFRPDEAGYYTWQWTIDAKAQDDEAKMLLPDGYATGDRFGLVSETSIRSMRLDTVTTVAHPQVRLGQAAVDTMTVTVANGEWLQADGKNIPVTYQGTAYFVAGDTAPEQVSEIPEDAEPMDTIVFEVSAAGDYAMPASRGEEHRDGYITWVWQIADSAQAEQYRGMTEEWADDFGVPAETTEILVPEVETLSQAGAALGGTIRDTAYVTGELPVRGAELTFEAYAIPMTQDEDGAWVIDYPRAEDGSILEDAKTDWSWVVAEENLIGSNLDGGEVITEAGEYHSPEYTVPDHRKVLWVESLWTIPLELPAAEPTAGADAQASPESEAEPTPDADAAPENELHPSYERNLIHRGIVGLPNETSFVLDVKTYAMSANGQSTNVEHGIETWDTAELTGYVPENGSIEFEAYVVPATDTGKVLAAACTTERLAWTSPAIALDGGLYPAGSPLEITGEAHVFNPDVDSALYWVAVVKDELGREVHRGVCGDPDETTGLKGQKLIATGGPLAVGGAAAGLLLLGGLVLGITIRRRRTTV